jgi:hypothetical protein
MACLGSLGIGFVSGMLMLWVTLVPESPTGREATLDNNIQRQKGRKGSVIKDEINQIIDNNH